MQTVDAHKTTLKGIGKNVLRNPNIIKCKKQKSNKVIETSKKVLVQGKKKANSKRRIHCLECVNLDPIQ